MEIPLYSSTIRRREMDAVLTCMVSEKIGPGEINRKFSQAAKEFFNMDTALPLRSADTALRYVFQALDLPAGSGVIISALSPAWYYKCIKRAGYEPVIADVDPETAQMTPESVQAAAAGGGRVLFLFDALGFLPDVRGILSLNIPVVEDISQSAGASYGASSAVDGETDGSGDVESAAENGSAGSGPDGQVYTAGSGAVFTLLGLEERDLLTAGGGAVLFAPRRREGIIIRRIFEEAPETDILSDMNAALALVQLKEMKRNYENRRDLYNMFLSSIQMASESRHTPMRQKGGGAPSYYSFPVVVSSGGKEVRQYASREGIKTGGAFQNSVAALLGEELEGCPHAKSLLMRCVLFPLYPRLGSKNAEKIAKVLRSLP